MYLEAPPFLLYGTSNFWAIPADTLAGSVVNDERGFDPAGGFFAPVVEDDPYPGKLPRTYAGD